MIVAITIPAPMRMKPILRRSIERELPHNLVAGVPCRPALRLRPGGHYSGKPKHCQEKEPGLRFGAPALFVARLYQPILELTRFSRLPIFGPSAKMATIA